MTLMTFKLQKPKTKVHTICTQYVHCWKNQLCNIDITHRQVPMCVQQKKKMNLVLPHKVKF